MAPGRLSSLLACALVLQLAAAPAAVVAVQHGTVAAADFDLAAAAGGRLTISGLALEGEAQPVTLELQRRDVWAPGSKVVVHTAAGTEELGPPASRFFHGSIAGQPHSTVALAVHEDGSVTGMASSGENSYVLGVDGGDAGAARGPGRALLSARRAVLEAPQRRGRRCGNRGSEMPPFSLPCKPLSRSPASSSGRSVAMRCLTAARVQHVVVPHRLTLRQRQPRHELATAAAAPRARAAAAAGGRAPRDRRLSVCVQARRSSRVEYEDVAFDDEEDWEAQGSAVQAPGFGLVVNTALRGLSAISERLTDFALQYAPADASPGVVRVAVNAGMLLLALSFVKSLLSFFLTVGTILLGAYVAVKVFGVDVAGITGSGSGGSGGSSGRSGGGASRPNGSAPQRQRRQLDPRARQSEFKGLLSSLTGEDDDGLLDVRFERRGKSGSGGSGKDAGRKRR